MVNTTFHFSINIPAGGPNLRAKRGTATVIIAPKGRADPAQQIQISPPISTKFKNLNVYQAR